MLWSSSELSETTDALSRGCCSPLEGKDRRLLLGDVGLWAVAEEPPPNCASSNQLGLSFVDSLFVSTVGSCAALLFFCMLNGRTDCAAAGSLAYGSGSKVSWM